MFWLVRWHYQSLAPRQAHIPISSLCLADLTVFRSVSSWVRLIIAPITTSVANNAMQGPVGRSCVQTETIQVLSGTGISYATSSVVCRGFNFWNVCTTTASKGNKTSGTKATKKFLDMEINELLRQWLIEPLTMWSWWINLITPRSPLVQLNLCRVECIFHFIVHHK